MQIDEPEDGANINVGLMKQFSGGDKIKARGLFRDPIEFKPQFKMILVCNDLPKVPPYDGGVWRRLEVVEFVSKFVEDADDEEKYADEENIFPRDEHLSEKLKLWKEMFMSILIENYKLYKEQGLRAPESVTKYTREYQNNCDSYIDFLNERMELTKDNKMSANIADVHREFKMWHSENNVGAKLLSKKELSVYFEKKYGKKYVNNDVLKGFKLYTKSMLVNNGREQTDDEEFNSDIDIQVEEHHEEIPEFEVNASGNNDNYGEF